MGKNKLAKFAEMEHFPNVFQPSYNELMHNGFRFRSHWSAGFFGNDAPIILELGCGKGEYTIAMAEIFPERNFIGIDIKGSRMFAGAKYALKNNLKNVAFIRTKIENIEFLFGRNEISEIWLTFPDPQMKKERKRLTSAWFLYHYRNILPAGGVIHLKTDSRFMYTYTCALAKLNNFNIPSLSGDLYHSELMAGVEERTLKIRTCYETQWIERGFPIKYISFRINENEYFSEPEEDFEKDDYRSFGRSAVQKKILI